MQLGPPWRCFARSAAVGSPQYKPTACQFHGLAAPLYIEWPARPASRRGFNTDILWALTCTLLEPQEMGLRLQATGESGQFSGRSNNAMAGHDDTDWISAVCRADRARGAWRTQLARNLA